MIQVDLNRINWVQTGSYIVIAILTLLLFRNCKQNEKLQLVNDVYKRDIKISQLQAEKYANRINTLNDSIIILQGLKQKEKNKIVTVGKEVGRKVDIVATLTTKGIANYYQGRYKLPATITQYGVALKDTVHKEIIVDLIKKDGLVVELNHTKNILNIAEKQLNIKDDVLILKDSIISEKDKQIDLHLEIEKKLNKQVKNERTKKTVWQIATFSILGSGVYLLVK